MKSVVRTTVLLSVFFAAGCGDEPSGAPDAGSSCDLPPAPSPAEGIFASPADFDREGCSAGAFEGFDPGGLWFMEEEGHGLFSGFGTVSFELTCEAFEVELGTFISTRASEHELITPDDMFWRDYREFNGGAVSLVDAFDLCRVNDDGTISGRAGHCFNSEDFGNDCGVVEVTLQRFGRMPNESEAEGLELVSEWAGGDTPWPEDAFTANVRVRDGVAYVARGQDGLRIVDVSDPSAPSDLGWLRAGEDDFNDVKIVDGPGNAVYALMASGSRGVVVVDVTDPTAPAVVNVFSPSGAPNHGVHTLFTETIDSTTFAYIADGFSDVMYVWDVSDPPNAVPAGSYTAANEDWAFHDLYAEGGRVYINATVGGLIIVDTQPDPKKPVEVGKHPPVVGYSHSNWVTIAGGRKVTITGDEGYGAHFEVVDVDPDSPEFMQTLGRYETRPQISAHNVMAFGERAYAAYYQDGVRIIDLSDPTNPTELAYFNTWSPEGAVSRFQGAVGIDVDLEASLIYVADTPRGLLVLRDLTAQ